MPLFLSYRTFCRVNAVALMLLSPFESRLCGLSALPAAKTNVSGSHEGADTRYGLADDQVLHLEGAFVGVKRFGIRKEASSVGFDDNAVSTEQLASPRHRLTQSGCAERLCERRMMIKHLAVVIYLRQPKHKALAGRHVREHSGEKVLYQLKRGDRLSELQSLLGVGKRVLVGSHLATRRQPADAITSHAQDPRGVPERVARLEPIRFRHLAILQCDQTVLDHLERDLVLDLFDAEARRRLVLNDETLDLVVSDVARPDDRHVAPRSVADPFLLTVENPS